MKKNQSLFWEYCSNAAMYMEEFIKTKKAHIIKEDAPNVCAKLKLKLVKTEAIQDFLKLIKIKSSF